MDRKQIEQKVKEILADRLDIDINEIKLDSDLVDDLGMDSFCALELQFELKEQLGIEILQNRFSRINTVRDIINYIYNIKKKKEGT